MAVAKNVSINALGVQSLHACVVLAQYAPGAKEQEYHVVVYTFDGRQELVSLTMVSDIVGADFYVNEKAVYEQARTLLTPIFGQLAQHLYFTDEPPHREDW